MDNKKSRNESGYIHFIILLHSSICFPSSLLLYELNIYLPTVEFPFLRTCCTMKVANSDFTESADSDFPYMPSMNLSFSIRKFIILSFSSVSATYTMSPISTVMLPFSSTTGSVTGNMSLSFSCTTSSMTFVASCLPSNVNLQSLTVALSHLCPAASTI